MKELVLTDGSVVECLDESFEGKLLVRGNIDVASDAISKITNDNLKRATLGVVETINNKVIDSATFTAPDEDEIILLTYILRDKDDMEIVQERLDEQDAALMELAELIAG